MYVGGAGPSRCNTDTTVSSNTFKGANRGDLFVDVLVDGNQVYNLNSSVKQSSGIRLWNGTAQAPRDGISIKNNTVRGKIKVGVLIKAPSTSKNIEVSRNTLRDINGERSPYSAGVRLVGQGHLRNLQHHLEHRRQVHREDGGQPAHSQEQHHVQLQEVRPVN